MQPYQRQNMTLSSESSTSAKRNASELPNSINETNNFSTTKFNASSATSTKPRGIMSQGNPFNFNNIFGDQSQIFGNKPSMEEQFKTIAEKNQIKVMQEKIDSLEAENNRLKELIIKCPKCGTKLRIPKMA